MNKRLSLFDTHRSRIEYDGYYDLSDERDDFPVLSLKDTAMNPKGWSECCLKIGFCRFDDGAELVMNFAKPFHNSTVEVAKTVLIISKEWVKLIKGNSSERKMALTCESLIEIRVENGKLKVSGCEFDVEEEDICGYMSMFGRNGVFRMCEFSVESETAPYTEEEHNAAILKWRKIQLEKADRNLDKLEKYIEDNPSVISQKHGDIKVSSRLVDVGSAIEVKLFAYGEYNCAFSVTKDCFSADAVQEPYFLEMKQDGDMYYQEITLNMDVPGNTKLEFWVNGERIVRQIAVLDKGYLAVIPWVGSNTPRVDEEIHRFDIPGDYWMDNSKIMDDPQQNIDKWRFFIEKSHKYGDRGACFVNGKTIMPDSETDSIFELDYESQRRGLAQIDRQMKILGFEQMELLASYTPDAVTIGIMEELGVKGLTSLCAWQNWEDGGWRINHCGVSNQPYYPASDDFRRSGEKRDIMCFTMGSSSCNRNYSIMVLDGCPSNIVPGERYFDHRVLHYNAQRFYDIFDGYIADSKNNENTIFATIAIESFRGLMDWASVNDMAIRYMVKKASAEKIVFTSAADISDYHKAKNLPIQEAFFFQPDYYYGYHNGEMPGRICDRIEAVTEKYLAVVRRGYGLPMYFYDYEKPWVSITFEDADRNEFGLINPDTNKPSDCLPKQIFTEDMTVENTVEKDRIIIKIKSETTKDKMVTGVFDIPYESDFETTCNKSDVKLRKVTDKWTGNTHLFVDMGTVPAGESEIEIRISGTPREIINNETVNGLFAAMWFGNHAYLRCTDKESAIKVSFDAPENAYVLLISGEKVFAENGKLRLVINEEWFNESMQLWNYNKEDFEKAIECAEIERIGATKCSRWSGQ
ncbi:MAG: hypothetical protein IKV88_02110 [Clostridia bacterium]|nr:hypothetical protein [Clostridia bacterium]